MNIATKTLNMAVEYLYYSFTYFMGKAYLNFTANMDNL